MFFGLWSMVYSSWVMVYGLWLMVYDKGCIAGVLG